jgi:signal transduction histidine kinase
VRELEDALLFKDQFLATMSHELRTPLNAVLGYSGIATMQYELPPQVVHMMERIKMNSKRLLNLINDILDISRINANRVEIVQRPINMQALAQGWHEDFGEQMRSKGLEYNLDMDPALPETIIGDEERLSQIAHNLVNNALKFTEKGSISLSVRKQDEATWSIAITDTGIGIPDTWHHLIFDEFRQVDGTSKRKYGGAGLGLSIVQKLCRLMGGNIRVTSKVGEGSTFTVTLPLRLPEAEVASA